MESNINGGVDTESIIEQRSNEDAGKCDHFSIRAYVAEIRKRDWKICWPFCSSVEFNEGKDFEGNVDMTSYEHLPLIDLVWKENISSTISNTKIRHSVLAFMKMDKYLEKTIDEGLSKPTCTRRKDIQFPNAETTNLNVEGGPKSGILDFEFGDRKLKCKRTCSNDTCYKDEPVHRVPEMDKTCEKGTELITFLQLPESESMESGSLDSQPSYHRNFCSSKSNLSDQNKDTEGVHGEQQSNEGFQSTNFLKCKRPRKIRLLSDILRGEISGGSFDLSSSNGAGKSNNMATRDTDTEDADDSDDQTLDTLFRSRKAIQPKTGNIFGCRNNKKRPQVEDMVPGQSRWSNGESEVSWSQNSNKENNSIQSVIGSSESVKTDISRDVAVVGRAEKRQRKSSFEGKRSFSKMSQENSCQELLLMSTDPKSKETQTGTGNRHFHLPTGCGQKSVAYVKENSGKGSLMPPHEFVPMKKRDGGKDVNIDPCFLASNKGSDSSSHLKNKRGAFKREKGSFFSCNYEKNIVVKENSEVTDTPSSEFDALDDISMEIVKLLAEKRREKLLLDAETVNRDTVSLLKSVSRVENPRKFQPTKACNDVKSTNLRKNTLQVRRKKPFSVGEDIFDETTSLSMEIVPQGRDPQKVCFPYAVNKSIKINGTDQMSETSSPIKCKLLDVEIYSKITAEKPCACVKKKILMSPKLDASLTTHSNEQCTHLTFGEPVVHIHSTERNIDSTRISGTRGQFSVDIIYGSVKSYKKAKLKITTAAMEAMNGRVNGNVSEKNTLGTDYQSFSINKVQSSASGHIVLPVEPNMVKGKVTHGEVKKKKKKGAVAWAVKGGEICSVNRNPADFSTPGTGNKFMRRGKSEKSRKGKPKPIIGKMIGNMKGFIPTCVE